jgi:hypothetical protein
LDAFFAQHAFPPAKVGDEISIAVATTAVPRISIMVNAETGAMQETVQFAFVDESNLIQIFLLPLRA